jgi:hypothetical protein
MLNGFFLMKGVIVIRHRLTDEQWELIADVFPKLKGTTMRLAAVAAV